MTDLRGDARLRELEWRDLTTLTLKQRVVEVLISAPWCILAIVSFDRRWLVAGVASSFVFFLTGLRQAHGAQHYTLGIPRRAQDVLLATLSVLMLSSLHALQATHMHHHRHAMKESDIESATARMSWWRAVMSGPWFIIALNREGHKLTRPKKRWWIWGEWAAIVVYVVAVLGWGPTGLKLFVVTMVVGECLTGFFAVWTVHHDCDPQHQLARTQRGWWKTALTYQMFYHVEHHLFPAVPTARLPELAARVDHAMPHLRQHQVF